MIKPAKLFLIRHAPVSSRKGFFPEHDPDAVIKKIQLKKLANVIPDNSTWYVSPLKRTIQTAEALSKYISYSKKLKKKNLAEQNFGDWSGKKISDVWKILKKITLNIIFLLSLPKYLPQWRKLHSTVQKSFTLAKKFKYLRKRKYSCNSTFRNN